MSQLQAALIVNSRRVLVALEDGQFNTPCHVVFSNGIEIYLADGPVYYAKEKETGLWLSSNTVEKFRIYFYPKGWWLLNHLANGTIERMITSGQLTLNQNQPLLCELLDAFTRDDEEEFDFEGEYLQKRAMDSAYRLQVVLGDCQVRKETSPHLFLSTTKS